jgi:hypothetical protein
VTAESLKAVPDAADVSHAEIYANEQAAESFE